MEKNLCKTGKSKIKNYFHYGTKKITNDYINDINKNIHLNKFKKWHN